MYAAEKAGYPARDAQARSWELTHNPNVMREVSRQQDERLVIEGKPKAVDAIFSVLDHGKDAPKVQAAKVVLDHCRSLAIELDQQELFEMDPAELRKLQQRLYAERAAAAKPVIQHESAQDAPTEPSQAVDIYD